MTATVVRALPMSFSRAGSSTFREAGQCCKDLGEPRAMHMRANSEATGELGPPSPGADQASAGVSRRWRLSFAYRAISVTALGIDLALIVASAVGSEVLYHDLPSQFEGEFSHRWRRRCSSRFFSSPR